MKLYRLTPTRDPDINLWYFAAMDSEFIETSYRMRERAATAGFGVEDYDVTEVILEHLPWRESDPRLVSNLLGHWELYRAPVRPTGGEFQVALKSWPYPKGAILYVGPSSSDSIHWYDQKEGCAPMKAIDILIDHLAESPVDVDQIKRGISS